MGLDYSYELLIPWDGLYEFLSCMQQHCEVEPSARWIWPDGRELALPIVNFSAYTPDSTPDVVPVDGSFRESPCLSLFFETDPILQKYLDDWETHVRKTNPGWNLDKDDKGRYAVGCIFLNLSLQPQWYEWLEGAPCLRPVSFTAATTDMSLVFMESPSIQNLFVELAKEGGAVCCEFDYESPERTLLYWRGEEFSEAQSWGDQDQALWRLTLGHPVNQDALATKRWCDAFIPQSHHDYMAIVDASRHENSGVRGAACRRLYYVNEDVLFAVAEERLHDADWRVRAIAANALQEKRVPQSIPLLLNALQDPHPEVRIAATHTLATYREDARVFEALLHQLQNLSYTQPELGILLETIRAIGNPPSDESRRPGLKLALEERLADAAFPLRQEVALAFTKF